MLSLFAYGGHFGRPFIRSFCQQLKESEERRKRENLTRLITASCGFPKKSSLPGLSSAASSVNHKIHPNGFGSASGGFILHHTQDGIFGDDAWFVADYDTTHVIGVADGVGGWRDYGVDASVFPKYLMQQCERVVKEGRFQARSPTSILSNGYNDLHELKQPIVGSSTVCIVVMERLANTLYSANLGDSGCLVVRSGSIVHRTQMQQHFFNTPFQLAMLPPNSTAGGGPDDVHHGAAGGRVNDILSDRVHDCAEDRFQLQVGDLVMVATDGLFDNLADNHILHELNYLSNKCPSEDLLRTAVERLATRARQMAHDPNHCSPFSRLARIEAGLNITGGKPDDITVLLSWVAPPGIQPVCSGVVSRPQSPARERERSEERDDRRDRFIQPRHQRDRQAPQTKAPLDPTSTTVTSSRSHASTSSGRSRNSNSESSQDFATCSSSGSSFKMNTNRNNTPTTTTNNSSCNLSSSSSSLTSSSSEESLSSPVSSFSSRHNHNDYDDHDYHADRARRQDCRTRNQSNFFNVLDFAN